MKVDPLAPQLLLDYDYFCSSVGPLPFGEFIALWHAADVVAQSMIAEGFEPDELPGFIVRETNSGGAVH